MDSVACGLARSSPTFQVMVALACSASAACVLYNTVSWTVQARVKPLFLIQQHMRSGMHSGGNVALPAARSCKGCNTKCCNNDSRTRVNGSHGGNCAPGRSGNSSGVRSRGAAHDGRLLWATKVWLHICRSNYRKGLRLYDIFIRSLRESLTDFGASVAISGAQNDSMIDDLGAAAGNMSTWVVALGWWEQNLHSMDMLKRAIAMGVRVVLYQTEPSPYIINSVDGFLKDVQAAEVWDYSRANLQRLHTSRAIKRFIPPGYARALDFRINTHSKLSNFSAVGWLGGNDPRLIPYLPGLNGTLVTSVAWKPRQYRDFLTRVPIQLNVHRGTYLTTMEATRMAVLLSNHACVISAPVDSFDTQVWSRMVRFATPENISSVLQEVRRDVAGCRLGSHREYVHKFGAKVLLQRAGISDLMRQLELRFLDKGSIQAQDPGKDCGGGD